MSEEQSFGTRRRPFAKVGLNDGNLNAAFRRQGFKIRKGAYGISQIRQNKALSEIVREMKDPRISPMTTIMLVEATNDLKLAKVRVSVYDKDDSVRKETVAQLNRAEGFIARELGRRIDIRRIPTLKFTLDDSIEYSVHISEIINKLQTERAQLDANRNNAEEDKENTQNED